MNEINYSIVIPCYSSNNCLKELVDRTAGVMKAYEPYELLLVNDKSPDSETWQTICSLAENHTFIKGIDLLYNVGQFRATLCGIEYANGKYIITMDDDLQHPPEELPKLIEAMHQNFNMDCIMGQYINKRHNPVRNAGSWLMKQIMNKLYSKPADIVTTSFRIMPATFAKSLIQYRIAHPQLGPLIISLTGKVMNVPTEHDHRKDGASGYSIMHGIREAFKSVINASIVPLRLFSFLGFVTAGVAFFIGLYFLIRWFLGGIGVPGFTTLILAVTFFSGMMLAGIGVLGEYIGRIIQELTGMPKYMVSQTVGDRHESIIK